MDRWLAKLISLILIFLLPFIFIVIPHHMIGWIEIKGNRGKRILCLLMCFGGGIFLATYLLQMGPEVWQRYEMFYVTTIQCRVRYCILQLQIILSQFF